MVVLWLFLSIFVDSWWNVRHNVDDICQITSSVFCFLVQIPHLGNDIVYTIHKVTSKRQRLLDVAL